MRWLRRAAAVLLLALCTLLAYAFLAWQPEDFPAASHSAERLAPGPAAVASLEHRFVDTGRPTPANGAYAGAPARELDGEVWYPDRPRAAPAPLLVFSHGFTSRRGNGAYLARHLASHGFVVVAVDYPLTSWGAPGGPVLSDLVHQPGDISFLIDRLHAFNARPEHRLYGRIDTRRTGVLGISLGGLTSLLVGFHREFADPRIDAVLAIAAPTAFLTPAFFSHRALPLLLLAADRDVLVPYPANAAALLDKAPGAELVTVAGGSHTGFSGGTAWLRAMRNTDAVGCWSVQRNIEAGELEATARLIDGPGSGLDPRVRIRLCATEPLPDTLNVLRQQMIARVVVTAFFEAQLAGDAHRRQRAATYLQEVMAREIPEASYRRAAGAR